MIEGIFNVRYDRLTPAETEYVNAMARLGSGPYRTSDVAKAYGSKTASKIRESLNKKGMIFSPNMMTSTLRSPFLQNFSRAHS